MGQDPDTIRQQIEETRAEMGETVDALGYKADVKARAKDNVHEKVGAVQGRVSAVKEKIVGQATAVAEGTPGAGDVRAGIADSAGSARSTVQDGVGQARQGARQAAGVAQENPLGLAIGAVAIGFLGGLLIPATRVEAEKIGPLAHDLRHQAQDAGHEAFEHGRAVATEAAQAAKEAAATVTADAGDAARDAAETVRASGREHADDLRTSVAG